jgi:hypothetical protein
MQRHSTNLTKPPSQVTTRSSNAAAIYICIRDAHQLAEWCARYRPTTPIRPNLHTKTHLPTNRAHAINKRLSPYPLTITLLYRQTTLTKYFPRAQMLLFNYYCNCNRYAIRKASLYSMSLSISRNPLRHLR